MKIDAILAQAITVLLAEVAFAWPGDAGCKTPRQGEKRVAIPAIFPASTRISSLRDGAGLDTKPLDERIASLYRGPHGLASSDNVMSISGLASYQYIYVVNRTTTD